jgi:hypothetical protein
MLATTTASPAVVHTTLLSRRRLLLLGALQEFFPSQKGARRKWQNARRRPAVPSPV